MENVRSVTFDEVLSCWFLSEAFELKKDLPFLLKNIEKAEGSENEERLRASLIKMRREFLISPISDCNWHYVKFSRYDLSLLLTIKYDNWKTEYNGKKAVKEIAEEVARNKEQNPKLHTKRILELRNSGPPRFKTQKIIFVKQQSEDKYTIIDGNHTAVAQYLCSDENSIFHGYLGVHDKKGEFEW